MNPSRLGGRIIAAGVMVAAIVAAIVDSGYWLIWGAVVAVMFANA